MGKISRIEGKIMLKDSKVKTLCIVPARGGLIRLNDKNTTMLNGKMLIEHTLDVALKCFDNVVFTTDSSELMEKVEKYRSHKNFIAHKEPAELATSTYRVIGVVRYLFELYSDLCGSDGQIWMCLPTCPLRTVEDVKVAQALLTPNVDGVMGITDYEYPPTLGLSRDKDNLISDWNKLRPWQTGNTNIQDHTGVFHPNDAIYGMWKSHFYKMKNFYSGKIVGYHMPRERSINIKTELDLKTVKMIMEEWNYGSVSQ